MALSWAPADELNLNGMNVFVHDVVRGSGGPCPRLRNLNFIYIFHGRSSNCRAPSSGRRSGRGPQMQRLEALADRLQPREGVQNRPALIYHRLYFVGGAGIRRAWWRRTFWRLPVVAPECTGLGRGPRRLPCSTRGLLCGEVRTSRSPHRPRGFSISHARCAFTVGHSGAMML